MKSRIYNEFELEEKISSELSKWGLRILATGLFQIVETSISCDQKAYFCDFCDFRMKVYEKHDLLLVA